MRSRIAIDYVDARRLPRRKRNDDAGEKQGGWRRLLSRRKKRQEESERRRNAGSVMQKEELLRKLPRKKKRREKRRGPKSWIEKRPRPDAGGGSGVVVSRIAITSGGRARLVRDGSDHLCRRC